jgi:hypothetical protein
VHDGDLAHNQNATTSRPPPHGIFAALGIFDPHGIFVALGIFDFQFFQ